MIKRTSIILVILTFLISGCKYEDGPVISLKTKMGRIKGEWKLLSFNDQEEITERIGKFTQYWYDCEQEYTTYETLITKKDVIWEFEPDFDIKQKYFRIMKKLRYGHSFRKPDCVPVYSTVDSLQTVDVKEWSFSSRKSELQIKEGEQVTEYEILRLTNSELKLENDIGDIFLFEKIK